MLLTIEDGCDCRYYSPGYSEVLLERVEQYQPS